MTSYKPNFLVSGRLCYSTVWSYRWLATFQRNILPLSWGQKAGWRHKIHVKCMKPPMTKTQCNPEITIQTFVTTKTENKNFTYN